MVKLVNVMICTFYTIKSCLGPSHSLWSSISSKSWLIDFGVTKEKGRRKRRREEEAGLTGERACLLCKSKGKLSGPPTPLCLIMEHLWGSSPLSIMKIEENRISKCRAKFPEIFFLLKCHFLFCFPTSTGPSLYHTQKENISFIGGQNTFFPPQQQIGIATSWPPQMWWLSKFMTETSIKTGMGRAVGGALTPLCV